MVKEIEAVLPLPASLEITAVATLSCSPVPIAFRSMEIRQGYPHHALGRKHGGPPTRTIARPLLEMFF
jgi:hypothetical protein